ncbi:hypothetical protein GKZ89_09935 [Bacillus mangrovi]|uniref:DUF308 domain-containing protein n=1 Tax=Metabacillus mangrovi TaxID=1491830 RepID=A0A7X2S5N8_9BACI|nr:DUF6609 family protein [Metabacillus mangrovi]MTH53723.1 hypothetical protein [Metabacillus mangrovi]
MANREYNTQRTCGVWLIYIGVIIIVSAVNGGNLLIQPFIFGFGYAVGFLLIYVLPFLNRKLAYGKNTKFQDKMDNITLTVTVILCTICGMFIGFENVRLVWLSILIVVGAHFFGFYFSQGKLMILLGTLTVVNGLLGLLIPSIPFLAVAWIDGALKMMIGVKMLFNRRHTYSENDSLHL